MNDQDYAANVKKILKDCISNLDSIKWMFMNDPEKDFTRNRKISFGDFISICLQMEGGALQNELIKYFDFAEDAYKIRILPAACQGFIRSTQIPLPHFYGDAHGTGCPENIQGIPAACL